MRGFLVGAYLLAGVGHAVLGYRGDIAARNVRTPYVYVMIGAAWPATAVMGAAIVLTVGFEGLRK